MFILVQEFICQKEALTQIVAMRSVKKLKIESDQNEVKKKWKLWKVMEIIWNHEEVTCQSLMEL